MSKSLRWQWLSDEARSNWAPGTPGGMPWQSKVTLQAMFGTFHIKTSIFSSLVQLGQSKQMLLPAFSSISGVCRTETS